MRSTLTKPTTQCTKLHLLMLSDVNINLLTAKRLAARSNASSDELFVMMKSEKLEQLHLIEEYFRQLDPPPAKRETTRGNHLECPILGGSKCSFGPCSFWIFSYPLVERIETQNKPAGLSIWRVFLIIEALFIFNLQERDFLYWRQKNRTGISEALCQRNALADGYLCTFVGTDTIVPLVFNKVPLNSNKNKPTDPLRNGYFNVKA